MLVEVKVPQLSESVAEATLLAWHKKAGQYVNRDENLVDIETDKVVLETPAPQAGVLTKIIKGDGGTVTSNEVIAQIDTEAAKPAAEPTAAKVSEAAAASGASAKSAGAMPQAQAGAAVQAMPAAQKLAADKHVDTATLAGTGRGGRVTKGDVLEALKTPAANDQGRAPSSPASAPAARAPAAPGQPTQQRAPAPQVDVGELGDRPEQ